jgi:hypothetical protein
MMDWNKETDYRIHGVAHKRQVTAQVDSQSVIEILGEPLQVIGAYKRLFWARLGPGGFIVPHIDAAPFHDRWHIPVEPAGWFWQDGEQFQPQHMVPFQVQHWLPHAVWNDTDRDRIHLIIDRMWQPPEAPDFQPLVVTDHTIPEIEELAAALADPV